MANRPRGLGFNQFGSSVHAEPKKISVYNGTTFGKNVPPDGVEFFEYEAPGPIDFMRSRMERTWYKMPNSNQGSMRGGTPLGVEFFPPISLVHSAMGMSDEADPYEAAQPVGGNGSALRKREKATIKTFSGNSGLLAAAGNEPATPSLSKVDKWLFILESDRGWAPTQDQNAHGIKSTFGKLRITPTDANSDAIKFYDHVFDYEAPHDKKEIGDNYYGSITVSEASIKPVYNFYVQPYEAILTKFTGSDSPPESILPSLYSFLSIVQDTNAATSGIQRSQVTGQEKESIVNTIFEKHATLSGIIKEYRVETEVVYNRGREETTTAVSKGQYFNKYAYAYAEEVKKNPNQRSWKKPLSSGQPSLEERFKNQIAPPANLDLFSTFKDVINRFPMYCEINFSTDSKNSRFLKTLEDAKLMAPLLKDFIDNQFTTVSPPMGFNFIDTEGMPFELANSEEVPFKVADGVPAENIVSGTLECWDLNGWVDSVGLSTANPWTQVNQGVFLGNFKIQEEADIGIINSMNRHMKRIAMVAQFNQLKEQKTRRWSDIIGGVFNGQPAVSPKKAYHETLFYKVEKWDLTGTEPIQNFYFPNSSTLQEHKFIDTQVKYGKRYIYRIFAYEAVFGTKYWYQPDASPVQDGSNNLNDNQARICILTEPSVRLIKVPYYEKEVIMMDSPPVMPDVDIIPYRGVEDKLLFWLRGNTGNYKLNPVIIKPGDQEIINSIRLAQELNNIEPVQFKSDDHPRFFEVFRIETKPAKYADFADSQIARIDTDEKMDHLCKSSTTGEWTDTIEPNQKYYYIFRTIDNHGHFSNPSPVYEIEMVHDGYAPFLLRKVYSLEDKIDAPQVATKSFSKYIYIKPAHTQTVLNKEATGLVDSAGQPLLNGPSCLTNKFGADGEGIVLGTSKQSLWEKTMKVRVVSKKSGKRIDINIKFKHSHPLQSTDNNENNKLC